jgi:hypothetical protein
VCDEEPVTWRQFMNDMAAQVGMPPPPTYPLEELIAAAAANEDPQMLQGPRDPAVPMLEGLNLVGFDNRIDSRLIRNRLNWVPKVTYQAGMSRQE